MYLLTGFTSDPKQTATFRTEDGNPITFNFEFRPQQLGWFFSLSYGNFTVNGLRLSVHPNLLVTYQNLIPFGLAVTTPYTFEPQTQTSLADGTVSLYLLNTSEVDSVNALFSA